MYLRDLPTMTLEDLASEVHISDRRWGGVSHELRVAYQESDQSLFFQFGNEQIPATKDGMEQVGSFLNIPRKFLLELPPDMQAYNIGTLLHRSHEDVSLRFTDSGITQMYRPTGVRLEPEAIVEAAMKVLGPEHQIVQWECDSDIFTFDAIVPSDYDQAIGGDRAVGDLTHGGLRFTHDRKHNRSPSVSTFLYRLACTNGMIIPETGLKVDSRGSTVEQVLAELELAAQHAFAQVEASIDHFYQMRDTPIEGDVTQAVIALARERNLPERTQMTLARSVPAELHPDVLGHDIPTMFDVVNLFTNQANDPRLRERFSTRSALETAGGHMVSVALNRCGNCHQVVR